MIAYKGFNKDLVCTRGKGKFQCEVGKTYRETKAECTKTGFHCVEEPIEVLTWYSDASSRYCIVDAGGDVHEDGDGRISCTEMKVLKEVTLPQLGMLECRWIQNHADRQCSGHVRKDSGRAAENGIVIVRGKNPKAAGGMGATIFLLREGKGTKEIEEAGVFRIDGTEYLTDTYYRVDGRKCRCLKRN